MQLLTDLVDLIVTILKTIVFLAPFWLPVLLLLLLVMLMFRAVSSMPRTKAQPIKPDLRSGSRWDDVAGLDQARNELQEIVEFLRHPEQFKRVGARAPKGVLLYGPPGTGKTLLARAVAGESRAAFFSQPASGFVEVYAGVGSARIRKLFAAARKNAPAIVFIDEIDAVGSHRSGMSLNREQDQTLNQLLVELDGFDSDSRVIIMASTNRVDTMDAALLRPGRFDRQVYVGPPDLAGRIAILAVHTRDKPLEAGVSLQDIARATSGLSGADLENICNEAAIRAGRAERTQIVQSDFDEALERVVAGLRTARTISEKEKRIIAYHEAGHALAGQLLIGPKAVHKITIIPTGAALGFTMSLPSEERFLATKQELEDQLTMLLAGRAAEQVVFGRISNGASGDLERVSTITRAMVFQWAMGELVESRTMAGDDTAVSEETKRLRDAEQTRLADAAYARARDLLLRHRAALDALAERLLERETLDAAEVQEVLGGLAQESANADEVGRVRRDDEAEAVAYAIERPDEP